MLQVSSHCFPALLLHAVCNVVSRTVPLLCRSASRTASHGMAMPRLGPTWLACALLLCDAAKHCPDGGIQENIRCFFYQDVDFAEQQVFRAVNFTTASVQSIASKAHQVDWPWWMAAACACILLPLRLYWLCGTLRSHNDLAYEELQQEEGNSCCASESDCGISATKTRARVLLEACWP